MVSVYRPSASDLLSTGAAGEAERHGCTWTGVVNDGGKRDRGVITLPFELKCIGRVGVQRDHLIKGDLHRQHPRSLDRAIVDGHRCNARGARHFKLADVGPAGARTIKGAPRWS